MSYEQEHVDMESLKAQLSEEQKDNMFMHGILDSMQNGICVIDKNYKIVLTNHWAERQFRDNKSLVGFYCYQTFQKRKSICEKCPVKRVFKTGKTQTQVIPYPSEKDAKRWLKVTAFPIFDGQGEIIQVLENFNDISGQKLLEIKIKKKSEEYDAIRKKLEERNKKLQFAEEQLQEHFEELYNTNLQIAESQQKYEGLYNFAPLAYQSLDINGNIVEVNPAWLKTLGYIREEVIGRWFGDFLHPDFVGQFKKNFALFKNRGYISDVQFRLKKKDNTFVYVSFEGAIGHTPEGEFKQTYCTFKDITKEKQQQNKLKLALEEAQNRQEEVSALLKASRIITVSKTFETAVREIFNICKKLLGAKSGHVALLSENGDKDKVLYLDSVPQPSGIDSTLPIPIQGLRSIATNIKDVVYENDCENSIWVSYMPKGVTNVLFAPLVIEKKAVGLLSMANKESGFTERDASMARAFVELATVALTHADHQEKLIRSEYRFKKLFENMKSGVAIYKPINKGQDFKFIGFNKMAEKIINVQVGDVIGRTLLGEFPNMIGTPFFKGLQEVHGTKKDKYVYPFYYDDKKRNGWWENYIYSLPSGEVVAIFSDVTDRIYAQQKLIKQNEEFLKEKKRAEESEDKFRRLVNNMYDLVCEIDENAVYTFVNNRYHDVLGYEPGELIGRCSAGFIHPEDLEISQKRYEEVKEKVEDSVDIWRFRDKEGNYKLFECKSSTYVDKENNKRTVVISQDITERHRNELELIEAKEKAEESDRLKTEFLNNMSHEIRTPMNGIIGFSEILDQKKLDDEKRSYYTSIIRNSSRQLLRIIDDILEISTLETRLVKPKIEKVCLNRLLMELFSIFDLKAKENEIPLHLKKGLSDKRSWIKTDRIRLSKILNNLVENALKFTFEGYIEVGYELKNKFIEIYVKDTGIGISSDNFNVIFKRFSQEDKELTRRAGGLGLGLSIAKENAELLGGSIWLKSKKDEGTTFYVSIPYDPVTIPGYNEDSIVPADTTKKPKDKLRILVVEDEEINYLYIEEVLNDSKEFKVDIIHARNGQEAVDICTEDKNISIVLMDVKMPVMNGYEATRKIKAIRPGLPVIAQTAYTAPKDREEALSQGCDEFITKPIDDERLIKLISDLAIV